jgi:hypothetical protein
MYQNGHVFATNDFLRGKNTEAEKISTYKALAFKFSTQTTGRKLWGNNFTNFPVGESEFMGQILIIRKK